MLRKITLLAMMLVFAFGVAALAGCGGDDEKSSSGGGGGGSSSQSDDSGGSKDSSPDVSDDPQVKQAVESCKQAVTAAPGLKDDTKADLEKLCDKAASGDIEDVKKTSIEVCEKIVGDTVPAGSAQDQAKAACKSAAG
jgi:hypothetical protein